MVQHSLYDNVFHFGLSGSGLCSLKVNDWLHIKSNFRQKFCTIDVVVKKAGVARLLDREVVT